MWMRTCSFEGCKYDVFGTDKNTGLGYCKRHQYKRTDLKIQTPQQKRVSRIFAVDEPLEEWFLERRKEMDGFCKCGCGGRSSKDDDKKFKYSICHIFPKAEFESVKTHPNNWIELAFWGGCHERSHRLDTFSQMKCWEEVVEKYKTFAPLIKEKHKYVYLFRQYAEPFL